MAHFSFRLLALCLLCFAYPSMAQQESAFRFLDESSEKITIEFILGDYSLSQIENGQTLIHAQGSGKLMQKGAPELPYYAKSYIIPDFGAPIITTVIQDFDEQLISNIDIAASKGNFTRDKHPADIARIKGAIYHQNNFFPEQAAEIKQPYIFRDFRGQNLLVYPFQYNPVSKLLRICKRMVIEIDKQSAFEGINPLQRNAFLAKPNMEFANAYRNHFINYSSALYTPLSERGDMLIISHQPFIPLLDEFVQWKKQSGMQVQVVSVAEAGGNNAAAIKDYIRNKFFSDGLTFVLLVGDHPQIPSLQSMGSAADPKYGFILGDDAYPEIIVGRISAESAAHVETQVRRFIDYEKATNMQFDFLSTCMQIASEEGPGDNGEYDHEHQQLIRQQLMNFTYTQAFEFYEGSQGGFDAPGNPTAGMVTNALNQGAGIINYTGHGWEEGWATSGFNNNDIAGLENQGKLPFIWSVACVNGDFANRTCFGERWLRATRNGQATGAIGAFMSSVNQYWNPPMAAQDEMVNLLTDPNPFTAKRTYGGLSVNGCMKMNDLYGQAGYDMTETWHLFGDPSLMVRTANPQNMTVAHPGAIFIHQTEISVTVSVENAFICLVQNGEILARGFAIDGVVNFSNLYLQSPEPITVTATAFNHIPYQGAINIMIGEQPFIIISDFSINDANGNQNGLADYSEEIYLNLSISNIGSSQASQLNGYLISVAGNAINLSTEVPIGSMQAGETFHTNNAFNIKINDLINDQETVVLTFRFIDNEQREWTINRTITLHAPVFEIQSMTITELLGNNNNNPEPGETILASYQVKNIGNSTSGSGIFSLSFFSNLLSTNLGELNTTPFQPGEVKEFVMEIIINPQTPLGTTINLQSQINAIGYATQASHPLRIGIMQDDAESGDLSYWPWVSDTNPWFADNSISFQGEYSFRSGNVGDNQSSVLYLTFYTPEADSVRFYRKVSTEDSYDFLRFYINNQLVGQWSGELDWQRFSYPVQTGTHQLRWEYVKDEIIALNMDAAWIDDVELPPLSTFDMVSVHELTLHSDMMSVFPNPAKDLVHIRIGADEGGVINIFASDGRLLHQQILTQTQTTIELQQFSTGLYLILHEQSNGKKSAARFVVNR
ncbi:MAG: C25 family cysteine peptidase [Flavobacteriales bacterium]